MKVFIPTLARAVSVGRCVQLAKGLNKFTGEKWGYYHKAGVIYIITPPLMRKR